MQKKGPFGALYFQNLQLKFLIFEVGSCSRARPEGSYFPPLQKWLLLAFHRILFLVHGFAARTIENMWNNLSAVEEI